MRSSSVLFFSITKFHYQIVLERLEFTQLSFIWRCTVFSSYVKRIKLTYHTEQSQWSYVCIYEYFYFIAAHFVWGSCDKVIWMFYINFPGRRLLRHIFSIIIGITYLWARIYLLLRCFGEHIFLHVIKINTKQILKSNYFELEKCLTHYILLMYPCVEHCNLSTFEAYVCFFFMCVSFPGTETIVRSKWNSLFWYNWPGRLWKDARQIVYRHG